MSNNCALEGMEKRILTAYRLALLLPYGHLLELLIYTTL
jgi:hypothetical protein